MKKTLCTTVLPASKRWLSLFLILLFCPLLNAQDHPGLLFHITKSSNRNIVCYDVSLDQSGTLVKGKPIHAYWINNEDKPGTTEELNLIQWKLAYGYKVIDNLGSSAEVTLRAYSKRSVSIIKKEGIWVAMTTIDSQEARLKEIHVHSKPGNSMNVEYIVLKGITAQGKMVEEKILR